MKWSKATSLVVLAAFAAACEDAPLEPAAQRAAGASASAVVEHPGHVVQFKEGSAPADFAARVASLGGSVDFVSSQLGFARVSGLSAEAAAALSADGTVGPVFEDVSVHLAAEPVEVALDGLDVGAASIANPAASGLFSWQWNLRRINAHTAWAAGFLGSPDVSIAILDSGIDYDINDMAGMVDLDRSTSFIAGDNNLITVNFPGRHFVDDLNGHGTNVATQASSNATFFAGVNSRTRLIGVKVLGFNGSGSLSSILAGIAYAADVGADVANMSLGIKGGVNKRGNGQFMALTNRAFNYAFQKGMVMVVSAGNDTTNLDNSGVNFRAYCEAPHVICVGATGPSASTDAFLGPWTDEDTHAIYSNSGRQAIDVTAPGGTTSGWVSSLCARRRIVQQGNQLFLTNCFTGLRALGFAGTSQAAPHVAGLAAKLVEIYGKDNPAQVKHALLRAVDDLGAPGRDVIYGEGRINVAKALGL